MDASTTTPTLTARARAQAEAMASRAEVHVRALTTSAEMRTGAQLITDVWGSPFSDHVLRALDLAGNYVSGAFTPDRSMVGASVAFAAVADEPELHSHVTGVLTSHQRSGVGLALKLHQRYWALEHGIETITWTFDPLVRRNAVFNLTRLAVTTDRYMENVYGSMDDALNRDDESDRLFVRWLLADAAVEAAASGTPRRLRMQTSLAEALRPGPDDAPVVLAAESVEPGVFSCRVPDDVQLLRASRPEVARAWRLAVRQVLGGALAAGGRLLGLDERGDYVVETADGVVETADGVVETADGVVETADGVVETADGVVETADGVVETGDVVREAKGT